jgi:hypothetical protein
LPSSLPSLPSPPSLSELKAALTSSISSSSLASLAASLKTYSPYNNSNKNNNNKYYQQLPLIPALSEFDKLACHPMTPLYRKSPLLSSAPTVFVDGNSEFHTSTASYYKALSMSPTSVAAIFCPCLVIQPNDDPLHSGKTREHAQLDQLIPYNDKIVYMEPLYGNHFGFVHEEEKMFNSSSNYKKYSSYLPIGVPNSEDEEEEDNDGASDDVITVSDVEKLSYTYPAKVALCLFDLVVMKSNNC